jgi:phage terminase large subunit
MGYEPTPENIEAGTANEYRWKVYGLGELSRLEGLIFPNYEVSAQWPTYNVQWKGYGLDFGYTNDPTALVEARLHFGKLYVRQWIFQRGLTNSDIVLKMNDLGIDKSTYIVADSAEPKSIEEIGRKGYLIKGVVKGKDSVMHGIDILKRFPIVVHNESKDLINEFNSYTWLVDRDGKALNKPIDKFNHGIDGLRYIGLDKYVEPINTNYEALAEVMNYDEGVFI